MATSSSLTFSELSGKAIGYGSNWFQPNKPFQLDLVFTQDGDKTIRIYSANDNNGTEPLALAWEYCLRGEKHLNVPVFDVIPDCDVYYKVTASVNPTSASYMTE